MRIAVGLPTGATGGSAIDIFEWAARADGGPFSSVGVLDRGASPGLEPLTVLAAVAASTTRVGLLASVVIGPTRETTLLARQANTIDMLSGGRLSLGLGIGVRERDYLAAGADFRRRGRRFDAQLPILRRLLHGEPLDDRVGPIGSPPARGAGVELLIGGYVASVARRIATWGDGFVAPGGGDPAEMLSLWQRIQAEWREAGREGEPRWVGASYYALGPTAEQQAAAYIESMYGHDRELASRRLRMIPTTAVALRALVDARAADGVNELLLRPCARGLDQLERLADVVSP